MPRTTTVDREKLHPEGVAGDPAATNPHEADPEPNTTEAATKASRNRVNAGVIVDSFAVVGDDLPEEVKARSTRTGSPAGRPMADNTLAALRFLRANAGKWVAVGKWAKPSAPPLRLSFAGFFADGDGNPVAPTEEQEKGTFPDNYPIKHDIEYKYGPADADGHTLYLRLTENDWTPPKKRGPRNKTTDVSTTITDSPDADTEPSEANA